MLSRTLEGKEVNKNYAQPYHFSNFKVAGNNNIVLCDLNTMKLAFSMTPLKL